MTGFTNAPGSSGMVFGGATSNTAGRKGLVPSPAAGDENKVLFGDGTWDEIPPGTSDWEAGHDYGKYHFAMHDGDLYLSLLAHKSSSSFAADFSGGKWQIVSGSGAAILDAARAWATGENSPDGDADEDSPTKLTQSSKVWAETSRNWAVDSSSPDGEPDIASTTGLTQSSRTWALLARQNGIAAEQYAEQTASNVATNAWSASTTYNYPDVVHYTDGYSYRCVGINVVGDVPGISQNWVCLSRVTSASWEYDTNGGIMPVINPVGDSDWELDENGGIMPTAE